MGPWCNECLRETANRVEIRLSASRAIVCGRCAVRVAEHERGCVIVAFVPAQLNPWVATDGSYFRLQADARSYQRTLDAKARAYAERVRGVVGRRAERAKAVA